VKDKITRSDEIKWDEHLYLEMPELKSDEICASMIEIQIYNKGFFKSDLIG